MTKNTEALQKALKAYREKFETGELKRLSPVDKAAQEKSRGRSIRAMCWECVGRGEESGAMDIIAGCGIVACPLWPMRPYQSRADAGFGKTERAAAVAAYPPRSALDQSARNPASKAKAIHAKCYECMAGEDISIAELRRLTAGCAAEFPQGEEGGYRGCPLWPHRRWKTAGARGKGGDPSGSDL